MPDRAVLEALLLYAASGLFECVRAVLTVRVRRGKKALIIRADARDLDDAATEVERLLSAPAGEPLLRAALRSFLSEEERQLVVSLGDQELPGSAIARHAGIDHSTRCKLLLANLTARGVLAYGRNGYRVAGPEVLELIGRVNKMTTPG